MSQRRLVHDPEGLNTAVWPVPAELITPVEAFFTRSHAPIPQIDAATWYLEVGGLVERPRRFTLEELTKEFERTEVDATLICAGMRRAEFLTLGPLPGELPWGPEPASTGRWAGVRLRDVLDAVGVRRDARHVELEGLDSVEREGRRFGFGGSIDVTKALTGDVLLATELNGAPIPKEHGFPVRAVVPGWVGARSVKWLGRITLSTVPSSNYFQTKAYRVQHRLNPADPRDVTAGEALSAVAINSVIVEPAPNQVLPAGRTRVRGWAIGTDCAPLTCVEISPNGRDAWVEARLTPGASRWTWVFWETELDLPRGEHTLTVRASDATGATQPENVAETWNVKGYANNAWHRVSVTCQ